MNCRETTENQTKNLKADPEESEITFKGGIAPWGLDFSM